GQASPELVLPGAAGRGFVAPPGLLQAALGVAAAAVPDAGGPLLPAAIDVLWAGGRVEERCWVHATSRRREDGEREAWFRLFAARGGTLVEASGVRFRAADRGAIRRALAPRLRGLFYEVGWEPREVPEAIPAAAPGGWLVLAGQDRLGAPLAHLLDAPGPPRPRPPPR